MADGTGKVMITREQALACLEILGLVGPPPSPDEMSRAESLGHLLFLVEASVMADTDRLDQEAVRDGYATAATMVVTGSMGIEGDTGTLITLQILAHTVADRIRRTRLDLDVLDAPVEAEGGWSPCHAIGAALDSVLSLLDRPAPPFVFDGSEQAELRAMRAAIETADPHVRTALSLLSDGICVVERLTGI
jgi:hypothetical protein